MQIVANIASTLLEGFNSGGNSTSGTSEMTQAQATAAAKQLQSLFNSVSLSCSGNAPPND